MRNNIKKKILLIAAGLLLAALIVWGIFETAGSDSYNYQGYVISIREDGKDKVLTTISGNETSEFTVKWYTREKYNDVTKSVQEGDHIKLSTTRNGSTNLKKFSVYGGYSITGKFLYVEGHTSPMLLTGNAATKTYTLYRLIADQPFVSEDGQKAIVNAYSTVKVYYAYPLMGGNRTIVTEAVQPISDIIEPLTPDELAYITSQGYSLP